MPKAAASKPGPQSVRAAPYPSPPKIADFNKENEFPQSTISSTGEDPTQDVKQPKKPTNSRSKAKPKPESQPKKKKEANGDKPGSFLDIKLEGEDDDTFPIYESPAAMRRKLKLFLGKDKNSPKNAIPGQFLKDGKPKPYTQAQLCKDMGGINPRSLAEFLKKTGKMAGGTSSVYPASYAFFEKKRIFEGVKKSKAREELEAEHPEGFPRDWDGTKGLFMSADEDYNDVMRKMGMGHCI